MSACRAAERWPGSRAQAHNSHGPIIQTDKGVGADISVDRIEIAGSLTLAAWLRRGDRVQTALLLACDRGVL